MTTPAPPGWYPHPDNPAVEFWWDGTQYTQSRPAAQNQLAVVQPAYAGAPAQYVRIVPAGVSPKSRTVASVLGFFLGGFGIDRFYLGNVGLGVAKLLVG